MEKGAKAIIALRPEDVIPHEKPAGSKAAPTGNSVPVTIGDMEFLGSFWRSTLTGGALGSIELTAQFSINAVRRLSLKAGKDILVELPADRLRAFPGHGGGGA
jgi:iron(III) transport system ATP-binding protein